MALIFAGIDGTGPKDQEVYNEAFEISFVKTIYQRIPTSFRFYSRGPTDLGFETKPLSFKVSSFIERALDVWRCQHPEPKPAILNLPNDRVMQIPISNIGSPKICLAGYSRGAAAVIFAAKQMAPLAIDYLILFDAVDRSPSTTFAVKIPTNVKRVWHVRRDPSAGSREVFGNCGTEVDRATTRYGERFFKTTHGGAGGTPWCTDPAFKPLFRDPKPRSGGSSEWSRKVRELETGSGLQRAVFVVNYLTSGFDSYSALRKTVTATSTNVTFAEDLEGSQRAWRWIASVLQAEGLISDPNWAGAAIGPRVRK